MPLAVKNNTPSHYCLQIKYNILIIVNARLKSVTLSKIQKSKNLILIHEKHKKSERRVKTMAIRESQRERVMLRDKLHYVIRFL